MIFQGIPPLYAAAGALAAAGTLLLLQFLRVRHPGRQVPSVMLWREARTNPRRQVLWEKLSRLASLLPALLAILAAAAALTGPVWTPALPPPRTVVVAEPGSLSNATALAEKFDPLRTALVFASSSGVVLREFGEAALPVREPDSPVPSADRNAVAALAARMAVPEGTVLWCGASPPPWLPEHGVFLRSGNSGAVTPPAPLRLFLENAHPALRRMAATLPGVEPVRTREEAELIFTSGLAADATGSECEAEAERLYEFLMRSGLYGVRGDNQELRNAPETAPLPAPGAVRLTGLLFALALLATLTDFLLWSKRKSV